MSQSDDLSLQGLKNKLNSLTNDLKLNNNNTFILNSSIRSIKSDKEKSKDHFDLKRTNSFNIEDQISSI